MEMVSCFIVIQGHNCNSIFFDRMEICNKKVEGKNYWLILFSKFSVKKINPTETGNCHSATFYRCFFLFFHKKNGSC